MRLRAAAEFSTQAFIHAVIVSASWDALSMERRAAVEALEAVEACVAALAVVVRGADRTGSGDAGPLRQLADDFLDGLAEASRMDAKMAALKVRLTAGYSEAGQAMASPAASPQDHAAQEMAVVAEVACEPVKLFV
ncbi:UNVERIFIED_ORG: hypothetical protein ABIB52_004074 [Arthrobacter sp. UYCu721]